MKYPDLQVFEMSALQHKGIDEVLYAVMAEIEKAKEEVAMEEESHEETVVYRYEPKRPDFSVKNLGNGRWKVESNKIDRLVEQLNLDDEEQAYQFGLTLKNMGVDKALNDAGVQDGDQVLVGTFIMEYKE